MYQERITLDQALILEESGSITIIDASPKSLPPIDHQKGPLWRENFTHLQSKARRVSTSSIPFFFGCKYRIEHTIPGSLTWRFLHGLENRNIENKTRDNIEYIYILINEGYPNIVKIGMTTDTVERRVSSINATSTLVEWKPKFAIPVSKGFALQIEQSLHEYFKDRRVTSDLGNSREFFEVDPLTAFDKMREVGALHRIGDPIVY